MREGDSVSTFYDPMIAKLVVKAANRSEALDKLLQCLGEYEIAGLPTNLPLLHAVASHPAFAAADVDTHFIERHRGDLMHVLSDTLTSDSVEGRLREKRREDAAVAAVVCQCVLDTWQQQTASPLPPPWNSGCSFRVTHGYQRRMELNSSPVGARWQRLVGWRRALLVDRPVWHWMMGSQ